MKNTSSLHYYRWLILAFIVFLWFFCYQYACFNNEIKNLAIHQAQLKITSFQTKEASLIIDYGDIQQPRTFKGTVEEGMTIYDALLAASAGGNFKINLTNSGQKIKAIDGFASNSEKQWHCYLNKIAKNEIDIFQEYIKPGDVIKFVYE